MTQRAYLKRSWKAMTAGKGWFQQFLLLGLIQFIPIFGQMVALGWFYGWARDVAWGVSTEMPRGGFFSEKTIKMGAMTWCIVLIWVLAGNLVYTPLVFLFQGVGHMPLLGGFFETIFMIILNVALLAWTMLAMVAALRATIYDSFTPVIQVGQAFKMFIRDWKGMLLIFCISLLVLIPFIIVSVIAIAFFFALFGGVVADLVQYAAYDPTLLGTAASSFLLQELLRTLLIWLPTMILMTIVFWYILEVASAMVSALVYHALGLWMQQFDLPAWRGMKEPLPFELVAAPVEPSPASAQEDASAEVEPPVQTPAETDTKSDGPDK